MADTWIISSLDANKLAPEHRNQYFDKRFKAIVKYAPHVNAMMQEPYFMDDAFRVPLEDYLKHLVLFNETLICTNEGEVMGAAVFSDVVPGRKAVFAGWINPEWRSGSPFARQKLVRETFNDVLSYAWDDLKLVKLTSQCATINRPAIRLLENLGFKRVGTVRYELQIMSELVDMFQYELINPIYVELLDGIRLKTKRTKQSATPIQHDEPVKSGDLAASGDDSERTVSDQSIRYREVSVEEQLAFADGSEDDE